MKVDKDIRPVFRKDILLNHFETVNGELQDTLSTISEECELLRQDNLARGNGSINTICFRKNICLHTRMKSGGSLSRRMIL